MGSVGAGFQAFGEQAPQVAQAYMGMVQAEAAASALDPKTAELAYLAVLAASRMTGGVAFHTHAAKRHGATRPEIVSAILAGLPAVGIQVLDALPVALEAYDAAGQ